MRGNDLSRVYVTHCLDRFRACLLCQSTLTRHSSAVVNMLRTVGHRGVSEVKNDINTVQFLAETNCFVSKDLNVSPRAAGFN